MSVVGKVYTVEEVMKELGPLGFTRAALYREMRKGKLIARKLGKKYIITEENLNAYLNVK